MEQVLLVMETPPELDHERVLGFFCHSLQDGLLGQGVLELLMRQDVTLGDGLESIQIRARLMSHQEDFARTAFPEDAHHLEVVNGDLPLHFFLAAGVGRLRTLLARMTGSGRY